jgi:hypothetical protein
MKLRVVIACVLTATALTDRPSRAAHGDFWPQTRWTRPAGAGTIPTPDIARASVVGIPGDPGAQKARAAAGLPAFSRYLVVNGVRYNFTLVGRDVFAARAKNVVVPVKIIPVRFVFPDGTTLDPTEPTPGCDGGGVPLDLTLQSPLFANYNYGDGPRQFYEFVRRIEFWPYTGGGRVNPNYSVRLAPSALPVLSINLPAEYFTVPTPCGRRGVIDYVSLEVFLRSQIFPLFSRIGITPSTFPLFLFHNIVIVDSDSFVGYHSAFSTPKGVQTYGVAEYDSTHESPRGYPKTPVYLIIRHAQTD